ncbi:DUF6339 family protein [Polynucleobacter sp. MWH-UH19D]|uniref:DUF6339 family protein n=1 Tax=Polynucleobacter sp. MWH-UH19D TaxID=1855610 RepID=UPI003364DD44
MSDNLYSVLKTESVLKLKRSLLANPALLELSFDDLCDELHLSLVTTNYKVNTEVTLVMPKGATQELNGDTENCKLILQILPELTPAQATDERLWVTLCFSLFKGYVNERWPFKSSSEEKIQNHISSHWFANGVRGRMRDNAISRLWWMGYMAKNIPAFSVDKVFEILFFNSDYRSSLLERNSSANAINVTTAILKITDEAYTSGTPFKRDNFRNFMMKVDTLGGRSNLAAMDVDSLVRVLKPIYKEAYEVKVG